MRQHKFKTPILMSLALTVLGCGGPEVIKLGVVVPLTGEYQSYGEANRRGIELALEEIQSNGYPLTFDAEFADTGSDPERAKELIDQRFQDDAFVVLGGTVSDEAMAMVPVADKWDRVLLSPSATSPDLSRISPNFYRIAPSDLTEGNRMADFAYRSLEARRVVILAEGKAYSRGIQQAFRSAFETHGGEILEQVEVPPNTSDLGGLIGRVITLTPDAVYLAGYEAIIAGMILELRKQDFQGRILTTHAFASPSAIARVGDDAAGVILTQTVFEPDSDHAHVQTFVTAYRQRYGEAPDLFAAEGYDAMKVMAEALKARHKLPGEVPRGLRDAVKDFPGVTGNLQFDEGGDVRKFPRVYGIGKDLALYDYSKRVEQERIDLIERQKEIQRKLDELRRNAANIGNAG